MHQSDIERFAFLFLCGKRDREILLGKEKMTFSDLDRLTYVTDFLGLTRLNLDIWHHYGEQFREHFQRLEQLYDETCSMEKMQITRLARRCYRELSGGQQQRVLLARALCATQKMLLLDEPVSGLDPKVTAEMYTLIEKLNREDGITVIMISHDVAAAVRYASHILHIGGTVFFGTKADYLQSPQGRLFDVKKGGDSQ